MVAICPRDGTVTLSMTLGYTFSKPIFYLSTEANDPLVAALEGAIHAPALSDLPFALEDAAPGESAERIYVFANGPTGMDNPFRQGLNSALSDGGHGPLNVLGGMPTINLDYSPIWRLFPVRWTEDAIAKGYRTKLTGAIDIENAGAKGIVEIDRRGRRTAEGGRLPRELPGRLSGQLTDSAQRSRPRQAEGPGLHGSGSPPTRHVTQPRSGLTGIA